MYAGDAGSGKTYHDLLLRSDVQAVIVALPILNQPEYIEAALAAGKHVLAEKPIAADTATAKKLIDYHAQNAKGGATLAIAENHRFYPSYTWAREQASTLGRVTHFSVRVFNLMSAENKYYGTQWRSKPDFQGGFLLDGGVHHAAATRLLLTAAEGDDRSKPASVHAITDRVTEHLLPIDTVNAIVRTRSGATGTYQHSMGSKGSAFDWHFAYEKGSVDIVGDTVTVKKDGVAEPVVKDFPRGNRVAEEVVAWAESLVAGKPNPLQSATEALADLEFLERMFQSGDQDGAQQKYQFQ